jgi:hypothetical protein
MLVGCRARVILVAGPATWVKDVEALMVVVGACAEALCGAAASWLTVSVAVIVATSTLVDEVMVAVYPAWPASVVIGPAAVGLVVALTFSAVSELLKVTSPPVK